MSLPSDALSPFHDTRPAVSPPPSLPNRSRPSRQACSARTARPDHSCGTARSLPAPAAKSTRRPPGQDWPGDVKATDGGFACESLMAEPILASKPAQHAGGAYRSWSCVLTTRNGLDILGCQWNMSPIYGNVGSTVGIQRRKENEEHD